MRISIDSITINKNVDAPASKSEPVAKVLLNDGEIWLYLSKYNTTSALHNILVVIDLNITGARPMFFLMF